MTKRQVVVIGAGLHGCAAAMHLARAGFDVSVVEKCHAGRHASGVNAGGVRRLGRHPAEIPLSVTALERWQSLTSIIGDDGGFRPCGQVKVAESRDDLVRLEARAEMVRNLGFKHEVMISQRELRSRLPALSAHCPGALVCDGDGAADPWRTTMAWQRQARRDGVRFVEGVRVVSIEPSTYEGWQVVTAQSASHIEPIHADLLVNCAGAWAADICAWLGEHAPVAPKALMLCITERISPFIEPVIGTASRRLSFKQMPNGTVLIGGGFEGTIDATADAARVSLEGLAENVAIASDLFPFMNAVRIVRSWAGIEGMTPDGIPVIGRSLRHHNVIHSFGYSGHGFQLSAITGEIVRDLALERHPGFPIEPFSIERFETTK